MLALLLINIEVKRSAHLDNFQEVQSQQHLSKMTLGFFPALGAMALRAGLLCVAIIQCRHAGRFNGLCHMRSAGHLHVRFKGLAGTRQPRNSSHSLHAAAYGT